MNTTELTRTQQDLPVREKASATTEATREGAYFEPPVDIYETDDALVLTADMPGVRAEDIETDLRDNQLTISAQLRPLDGKWKSVYQEYQPGHYWRQFRVGQQIDQTRISAEYKEGVLRLTLPKSENARPRRIQVRGG